MTKNLFKVQNKNGNLRLRYSGGILHEKRSLNGWSLPSLAFKLRTTHGPKYAEASNTSFFSSFLVYLDYSCFILNISYFIFIFYFISFYVAFYLVLFHFWLHTFPVVQTPLMGPTQKAPMGSWCCRMALGLVYLHPLGVAHLQICALTCAQPSPLLESRRWSML
jgi:hypothetical protein